MRFCSCGEVVPELGERAERRLQRPLVPGVVLVRIHVVLVRLIVLIDRIIGQVSARVGVLAVGRGVRLRGEAREALLVRVRAQRLEAGHEHVDAQVELALLQQQGRVNVLLHE